MRFSTIFGLGEALVREPFQRLIEERALSGYKYTGF
jgi:hypothetical protein